MSEPTLFANLPEFPTALPDDELRVLAYLPLWDTTVEIDEQDHAPARRLEKRGLIKITRWKDDPIAVRPTWCAGKLQSAMLTGVQSLADTVHK